MEPAPHPTKHRYGFALLPAEAKLRCPKGWSVRRSHGWCLASHPDLPVVEDGDHWILGWPVASGVVGVSSKGASGGPDHWAGRFATIKTGGGDAVFNPDAGGSLAAFYKDGGNAIASDPRLAESILPGSARPRPGAERQVLAEARDESGTWNPGGLCPEFADWKIILPSHQCEAGKGKLERTWPPRDFCAATTGGPVFATEIGQAAATHLAAWAGGKQRLEVRLSAGRDSRMVLASCSEITGRCTFSVTEPPPHYRSPEVEVSQTLAEVLGLRHRARRAPLPDHILVHGFAGEIGRGHYWPEGAVTLPEDPTEAAKVLRRTLRIPDAAASLVETELATWRAGLAGMPDELIFDLLYLEQRMATTMGPLLYDFDQARSAPSVIALNSRAIYRAMMQAPIAYRRAWRLSDDLCEDRWPAVRLVPINKGYFTGREKIAHIIRLLQTCNLRAFRSRRLWRMFFADPPNS